MVCVSGLLMCGAAPIGPSVPLPALRGEGRTSAVECGRALYVLMALPSAVMEGPPAAASPFRFKSKHGDASQLK